MTERINPGSVMGIIGDGSQALFLAQTALRMGYRVFVYNTDEVNMAGSISDEHWIGSYQDRDLLRSFAKHCDVVIYSTHDLGNDMVRMMMEETYLPQGEEILSLTQDKALQKVRLDTMKVNVAPYATVLSKKHIRDTVDLIGFPILITNNFSQDLSQDQIVIYEDSQIDQISDDFLQKNCMMEAWLPNSKKLSIIVAIDAEKQIHPVSLSELVIDQGNLAMTMNPPKVDEEIALEMYRISQLICNELNFIGVMTVDFSLTPQGSIYVDDIKPYTTEAGLYTTDSQNISQYEMFIRVATGLPVPHVMHYLPSLSLPFYESAKEKILGILPTYPEALIHYYNEADTKLAQGHLTLVHDDLEILYERAQGLNFIEE